MQIKKIEARIIRDSRNQPTIEVSVNECKASSPSGKSKGKYETPSYHKDILWNIGSINNLSIPFEINSFSDLKKVESLIKKNFKLRDIKDFGANALFALESSILKALAKDQKKELWQIINLKAKKFPTPLGNAIGGGLHSSGFSSSPIFQEFLLIPKGKNFKEKAHNMNQIYIQLQKILKTNTKNDEGALQCSLTEEEIIELLLKFNKMTKIGLDIAASSFFKSGLYNYRDFKLNKKQQISYINKLIDKYSPYYIEDPLDEEDFSGFAKIKKKNLICGDDLTVTHLARLKKAVKSKSINSIIIKPNQNGSLIEVKEIFDFCKKNKIKTILSHRSGETLDNSLADFAFAFQADFIKCGISTPWREVKLRRMINIERSLFDKSKVNKNKKA